MLIERLRKKHVGFLGLSFKAETDDLRESPILRVIGTLVGKGLSVLLHDPHLDMERVLGANRRFVEDEVPYLPERLRGSLEEVVAQSEVIVIANQAKAYAGVGALRAWLRVSGAPHGRRPPLLAELPRGDGLPHGRDLSAARRGHRRGLRVRLRRTGQHGELGRRAGLLLFGPHAPHGDRRGHAGHGRGHARGRRRHDGRRDGDPVSRSSDRDESPCAVRCRGFLFFEDA